MQGIEAGRSADMSSSICNVLTMSWLSGSCTSVWTLGAISKDCSDIECPQPAKPVAVGGVPVHFQTKGPWYSAFVIKKTGDA